MSKQYLECPLFNHENCKELHNRKVCAIVRKDKVCLRNIPKAEKKAEKEKELRKLLIETKLPPSKCPERCRGYYGQKKNSNR